MFDKGMMKAIMFLLVILLVTCVMMVPSHADDAFLGMPKLNKEQCNLDCQNKIRKEQHAAKMAATQRPTQKPTQAPAQKTAQKPTQGPTQGPTQKPTQKPTQGPTQGPTQKPTQKPK